MSMRPGKAASAAGYPSSTSTSSTALPNYGSYPAYHDHAQEEQQQHQPTPHHALGDAHTSSVKLDMASEADQRIQQYRAGASFKPLWATLEECPRDLALFAAIFFLSAAFRFWDIQHPSQVVFDEVHFGKFASYYLRRQYFFDVHPPFAKLLYAFQGWLMGYDGHFDFDNIGDDYIKNRVPYVGLRALPALLGSLTPAVVFGIMKETGHPPAVSVFSALLVALDNAHICQTRLILLDAPCLFFMVCSIYTYVRFYKLRYNEFSKAWWGWMMATGVCLALTVSSKINGLFTPLMIGAAVVIDLWNILDIRRQIPMNHVVRHFMARVYGLILIPAMVYLFWFWVHFAVLTKSGTGDDFMSPAFQETLQDSAIMMSSQEVYYHDVITLQHKQTKAYLHSHPDHYPLKYDDGRISSQGQQVTGYAFEDSNNDWQILPTRPLSDDPKDHVVKSKDVVQLVHINTNTTLLTHDVASPLMATNTEFTTVARDDEARVAETKFRIEFQSGKEGKKLKSKKSMFKLVHLDTNVALWTHSEPALPEWGASQQEVNGNKNVMDKSNMWTVDSIRVLEGQNADPLRPEIQKPEPKPPKKRNFFLKFFELQTLMFQHNAGLTDSHPYASGPINWPFLISGISFWTGNQEDRQQIYLIGNVAGWWVSSASLAILAGVMMADAMARRRGFYPIPEVQSNRLWNTTMFFVMGWAVHYFPHYLMSRQLFLHHYMPAHILSTMVAGSMIHFVVTESINSPISIPGPLLKGRLRRKSFAEQPLSLLVVIAFVLVLVLVSLIFIKPLTYGTPGLSATQVGRRRILDSWTLHYAK